MNRFTGVCCALMLLMVMACSKPEKGAEGSLFVIGGGTRSAELIKGMLETAGLGPGEYILILPMASAEPEESTAYIASQLTNAGASHPIHMIDFRKADSANPALIDSVANAGLIYIPGGDQSRFMASIEGSGIYDAIHQAYMQGACIAGTSAGAAVMSRWMITGTQLSGDTSYQETFDRLVDKNIEFKPGLGLLTHAIIDQHFIKRSRYNRLFSALAAHPDLTCIGIDESTAIIVKGDTVEVMGENQVVVAKNPEGLSVSPEGRITFQDIQLQILADGARFVLP